MGDGGDNKDQGGERKSVKFSHITNFDWHKDVAYAIKANKWENIRGQISLQQSLAASNSNLNHASSSSLLSSFNASFNSFSTTGSEGKKNKSFWTRFSGKSNNSNNHNSVSSNSNNVNHDSASIKDPTGLLTIDSDGRTPLHVALTSIRTPKDILLAMMALEPRAVAMANHRGRYPLHFAVVHRHEIKVIAELVDAHPAALGAADSKGLTPLAYAVDGARRETDLTQAPRTFWMPVNDNTDEAKWQEEQGERWGIVHWLLLSSATHPQSSLSVGGKKPMLVDALIHAAPPAVISLLIGASVMLLSHENRATAFAGSTLYSCIARHYPVTILISLVSQCPKDVRLVRDETGMGLISSQFISGCFEQKTSPQDWVVNKHFYDTLLETIEDEELNAEDIGFVDWWQKIEFLIAFCSGRPSVPKTQLLHAALRNVDTPPAIVRLLIALFPQSMQQTDDTGSFPLYIIAGRREYIPRNYEIAALGTERILDIILSHDRKAVSRRHAESDRLPLHAAIDANRPFSEIRPLVMGHLDFLHAPDPVSKLYPFLQAAVGRPNTESFRWACIARNRHSHVSWKELSDRQKASVVLQVSEAEDVETLETIFQLLRLQPSVLEKSLSREEEKKPVQIERDNFGMGMVAAHFISWCFVEQKTGVFTHNKENIAILSEAMKRAPTLRDFTPLSRPFEAWWSKLKYLIRYCSPTIHNDPIKDFPSYSRPKIPQYDEKYLLHSALSNSDTPPQVIALLVAKYPDSARLPLPDTSFLPLHIAAQTHDYTPRFFETVEAGALEIVFRSYPEAARIKANCCLPVHFAIQSGKSWNKLKLLIDSNPGSLVEIDSVFGLYPFQLLAMQRDYSPEDILHFEFKARNRYNVEFWKRCPPQKLEEEVRLVIEEYELGVLSSTFEFLKRSTSTIHRMDRWIARAPLRANALVEGDDTQDSVSPAASRVLKSCASGLDTIESNSSLDFNDSVTSLTVSNPTQNTNYESPTSKSSVKPSLSKLLAHDALKRKKPDVYECDASVLSGVDVMSTLSNSYSAPFQSRHTSASRNGSLRISSRRSGVKEDSSSDMEDSFYIDDSEFSLSVAEFAEDSETWEGSKYSTTQDHKLPHVQESEQDDESESTDNPDKDDNELVYFLIRKHPRIKTKIERDAIAPVKLSKKSPIPYLGDDLDTVSTHSRATTIGSEAKKLLASSHHSKNDERSSGVSGKSSHSQGSYVTIRSDEKKKLKAGAEMLWVGDQLYKKLLGNEESSSEVSLVSPDILEANGSPQQKEECSGKLMKGEEASLREERLKKDQDSRQKESRTSYVGQYTQMSLNGNNGLEHREIDQSMVPGIAAYLDKTSSHVKENENEASMTDFSNTPSTLSYLDIVSKSSFSHSGSRSDESAKLSMQQKLTDSANVERVDSDELDTAIARGSSAVESSPVDLVEDPRLMHKNEKSSVVCDNVVVCDVDVMEEVLGGDKNERPKLDDQDHIAFAILRKHHESSTSSDTRGSDEVEKEENTMVDGSLPQFHSESVRACSEVVHENGARSTTNTLDLLVGETIITEAESTTPDDSREGKTHEGSQAIDKVSLDASIGNCGDKVFDNERSSPKFHSCKDFTQLPETPERSIVNSSSTLPSSHASIVDRDQDKHILFDGEKEVRLYFDMANMRWRKTKEGTSHYKVNMNATVDAEAKIYFFDKKAMRWKIRDVPSSTSSVRVHNSNGSKTDDTSKRFESDGRSQIGMPFVDYLSRTDLRKRNKALADAQHSLNSKEVPKKSPREIRDNWKQMFHAAEESLCCLFCNKNSRQVLMIPCRHLAICRHCSSQNSNISSCPLCHSPSTDRMILL